MSDPNVLHAIQRRGRKPAWVDTEEGTVETRCGLVVHESRARTHRDRVTCARCRRVIEREKEGRDG